MIDELMDLDVAVACFIHLRMKVLDQVRLEGDSVCTQASRKLT
eukprot:CAMPEP_0118917832 /NCGR_PEP_ID=MMETSP1166-20130328/17554_1 /TAXON_ID=1104430 /ORGANISM="Chrysoreinhardia sp, Strain CCMP3193" /LENGTH=42 /DNA_ID= /DNA_START= /DNA_END= /DNA_ORIENTATION=